MKPSTKIIIGVVVAGLLFAGLELLVSDYIMDQFAAAH